MLNQLKSNPGVNLFNLFNFQNSFLLPNFDPFYLNRKFVLTHFACFQDLIDPYPHIFRCEFQKFLIIILGELDYRVKASR
jgi:hypothetical protein